MTDTIVSLVPAEPGWRAFYSGDYDEPGETARIVAWALIEGANGTRSIVGLVIAPDDPTRIVAAPEATSAHAPTFDRYGFKGS